MMDQFEEELESLIADGELPGRALDSLIKKHKLSNEEIDELYAKMFHRFKDWFGGCARIEE